MSGRPVSTTLEKLRRDHRFFARLLKAVTHQIDLAAAGGTENRAFLKAIIAYFEAYPATHHHPCEELIYGHLICQRPSDARGVFTLLDDHHGLAHRTDAFRTALEALGHSPKSRAVFISEARAFVASQLAHIQAEEAQFFPDAERVLTPTQWAEVDRGLCGHDVSRPDALPAILAPFADLLPTNAPSEA